MMSAPSVAAAPSPFRSPGGGGMLRTNPWQPAAHAPEGFGRFAVGGSVYSLFPSVPSATEASAIYSQASNSPGGRFGGQTSAATFHSFLSAQKGDTLFSAGFPLTPNSIPSSSPQQHQLFSSAGLSPGLSPHLTPLEAERGLSQLELMARGFTSVQQAARRPEEAKEERKPAERRPRQKEKRQPKKQTAPARDNSWSENDNKNNNNKKSWSNDSKVQNGGNVKSEVGRTSCGCSVSNRTSTAVNAAPGITITASTPQTPLTPNLPPQLRNIDIITAFHPPVSSPLQHHHQHLPPSFPPPISPGQRSESESRNGGCSRTTPVPPRSRSSESSTKPQSPAAAAFTPVVIKKEAGSTTPCQVAEITTSRTPAPLVSNNGTKVATHNNNNNNILPHAIKIEPNSDTGECTLRKDKTNTPPSETALITASTVSGIPVGIAVARQRNDQITTPVHNGPSPSSNDPTPKSRCVPATIAPAPPEKSRDDFRVLLPTRGRPAVVSTCVLTSVQPPAPVTVQATGIPMHHERTLTIPASSILLQPSSNSSIVSTSSNNTNNAVSAQQASNTTTTTLQVQTTGGTLTSCDEATAVALATARLTNGIPPWASHNSALTPPTLWLGQPQYPTGHTVPVQLEAPPAMPHLPPMGLQLVRDPVSGHLLLLPAASLEHLQRAAAVQVWPSSTSGFTSAPATTSQHLPHLMLHQTTSQSAQAPGTQHITLFHQPAPNQPTPNNAVPNGPVPETEFRILLPPQHAPAPQLALLHEAIKGKKPGEVLEPPKIELLDTMAKLLPDMSGATSATQSTFPASFVFPQAAPPQPQQNAPQPPAQLQYFYEQLTAGVQIAPQTPLAALPPTPCIDSGRRSQGTSPANPAEGCLTPPPEASSPAEASCAEQVVQVAPSSSQQAAEETHAIESPAVIADSSSSCTVEPEETRSSETPVPTEVTVQDASNQTETPPVSEDETTRDNMTEPETEPQEQPVIEAPVVVPPPVDLSGLELLSNSIEQFTQREKEAEEAKIVETPSLPTPPVSEHMVGGLGLLCALAEQRFMEDIVSSNNKEINEPVKPVATTEPSSSIIERIDINRNYKSPKSEREIKKFIAAKVSQYQEQSSLPSSNSDSQATDFMDAMELDMRMRLAELQRRYKEKQKELSRLQHPRRSTNSDDGSNSPGKRGPGRPRKRKLSSSPQSPSRSSSRSSKVKIIKERSPPVLEKVIDATNTISIDETETPKLKSATAITTKDILKPPTLTANKILTSAKFKPSACKFKLPPCNVTIPRLKTPTTSSSTIKVKTTNKAIDDEDESVGAQSSSDPDTTVAATPGSSWLAGGGFSSFRRHAAAAMGPARKCSPLGAQQPHSGYTFGSKQLTPSLLSGGEKQRLESLASDSLFWFLKPDKELLDKQDRKLTPSSLVTQKGDSPHQFGSLPVTGQKRKLTSASEAESDQESASTPSLFSTAAPNGSSSSCSSCSSSSSSSSSKKRKPGRPKRRAPSRQDQASVTETIVAKKPKSISFLLTPPPPFTSSAAAAAASLLHKPKIKPKLKAEAKIKSSLSCDDEDDSWPQHRTNEPQDNNGWTSNGNAEHSERPRASIDAATRLGAKKKLPDPCGIKRASSTESRKKSTEKPATARDLLRSLKKQQDLTTSSSTPTNNENTETQVKPALEQRLTLNGGSAPSCLLTSSDLESEPRALAVMGGLVYAGHVTAIRAPDVYGITLDGERGNRPHIFPREEMLKEAIREVKPHSTSEVPPGTRICAYWSQQYRCLYPGTVAAPTSPDPELDQSFVNVEFDDGDSGRIHLDDIRMLPADFPIVEYDPNPLLSLAKRRRRASGASSTEGRRTSSEVHLDTCDDMPMASTPTPSSAPEPEQRLEEPLNKESKTESKSNKEPSTDVLPTKQSDDEERERRRQKKREKAKKKEKLRKLLARGVAALGKLPNHKKHKKHRCEDRHHHKHHHRRRKHRHHRHDKSRSTEASSTPASSSPAPEPVTPEVVVVEPPPKELPKKTKTKVVQEVAPSAPQTEAKAQAKKRQERQSSGESRSKMAAFLPARQLWRWAGRGYKRPGAKGRGKKEFFKSIQRGKETINVGDCAVFLSTGRPDRPYIGRIETMWESWGGNMVVRVKWFYHPEETKGGEDVDRLKYPGALFQSPHADENDVQTISHRCEVLALSEYTRRLGKEPARYNTIYDNNDIYYLAGNYDPTAGVLTMEPGVIN